jgi:magnesium chelatase family protein
VDAFLVKVEVDLGNGLPSISVVGLPEGAVREGRERVMAALHNACFDIPPRKITINLAPADVPKQGSAFDLPIAIGILAASDVIPQQTLESTCILAELGLDGNLRSVRGALPIALRCRDEGIQRLIVPPANAREAAVVEEIEVCTATSLADVVAMLKGSRPLQTVRLEPHELDVVVAPSLDVDFADVKGQDHAKRALEIAAAGQHNILMIGPPGSGKSMLARRLATILPPMNRLEALEVTKVHSVAGRLRPGQALIHARPFRAPHHTVSDSGLVGGGSHPRPGEASLAHHGVLFLDELPEFRRHVLDSLRQPLEDGHIVIGRARASVNYPARFMLAAAMNPCPCGYHGSGDARCSCHPTHVQRYVARVSGPLLDRFDLHVAVPAVPPRELLARPTGEPSASIRERVVAARVRQLERFRGRAGVFANAHMSPRDLRNFCEIEEAAEQLMRTAIQKLGLSARAYHRVLRLARTIADLDGNARIVTAHVAEAIQYRTLDRRAIA